jgi:hypothetical protein
MRAVGPQGFYPAQFGRSGSLATTCTGRSFSSVATVVVAVVQLQCQRDRHGGKLWVEDRDTAVNRRFRSATSHSGGT